jgi:multiple sugar transport system permease protein
MMRRRRVPGGTKRASGRAGAHRPGSPKLRRLGNNLFVVPALLFIALAMIYPLGYNAYLSLRDVTVGNYLAGTAPFVGLENYSQLAGDPAFRRSLAVSALFTGGSLALQFALGFGLALFFGRPFPGANLMRASLLLGWLLPTVVVGNVWRWMLDGSYGVVNALLQGAGLLQDPRFWLTEPDTALVGVILADVWKGVPFTMVLLLAGLQGVPPSLYEAAKVDGASAWQRFLHITLPQMRPVALTVLLLNFIYTFKTFDLIFIMTGGGPVDATATLPILVYDTTFEFFRFGDGAAAAMVLLLISLVLSFVYLWLIRREEAA